MTPWDRIYESPDYRRMIARKTRFIVTMTVFFIAYYFALPILVGYWPRLMARPALGAVNWAYLFAFSQFVMSWTVAYLYMRYAGQFDQASVSILAEAAATGPEEGNS